MAGYQTGANFNTGDTVEASDSKDEFSAIDAAFDANSGHTHGGAAGEGAAIASDDITYDPAVSGLAATDVKAALDEIDADLDTAEAAISQNASDISDNADNIQTNTDDIANLSPTYRGALVTKSSADPLTTGASLVLGWNVEPTDTDNIHDNVTNNSRLTVPAGVSKVRVRAQTAWEFLVVSGTYRQMLIKKNGSSLTYSGRASTVEPPTDFLGILNVGSGVLEVTPGDYFEVEVGHDSGITVDVLAGDSWFEMEIVE